MLDELAENTVRVWYCFSDDASVIAQRDQHLSLLAKDEIVRYERFAFEKDRRLFLVARSMLRTMLSRYAPVAPDAWKFQQTDRGKIFLPEDPRWPRLEFNISHCPHVAVCAVAIRQRVGVDVESLAGRTNMRVARYFLSPTERAQFLETTADQQRELFFRLWTLKEAYAKALGMGLSLPFREFSFCLSESAPPQIVFDRPNDIPASHWQFHQQMITSQYCLAVAVERHDLQRMRFIVESGQHYLRQARNASE